MDVLLASAWRLDGWLTAGEDASGKRKWIAWINGDVGYLPTQHSARSAKAAITRGQHPQPSKEPARDFYIPTLRRRSVPRFVRMLPAHRPLCGSRMARTCFCAYRGETDRLPTESWFIIQRLNSATAAPQHDGDEWRPTTGQEKSRRKVRSPARAVTGHGGRVARRGAAGSRLYASPSSGRLWCC
ncbi:hypothetical protein PMIN06_008398 [Paraphaeosphaeria minitans]